MTKLSDMTHGEIAKHVAQLEKTHKKAKKVLQKLATCGKLPQAQKAQVASILPAFDLMSDA